MKETETTEINVMTAYAKYCKELTVLTNDALGSVPAALVQQAMNGLAGELGALAAQQMAAEMARLEEN